MFEAISSFVSPILGFIFIFLPLIYLVLIVIVIWLTKKLIYYIFHPYKLRKKTFYNPVRNLIFGRPGAGKTTLLVHDMVDALRDNHIVVSNVSIKWFGYSVYATAGVLKLNSLLQFIFLSNIYTKHFNQKRKLLQDVIDEYQNNLDNILDPLGRRIYDETVLRKTIFDKSEELTQIEEFITKVKDGFFRYKYYSKDNYIYEESLEKAIILIINKSLENPELKFLLAFDEGFSYLDHSRKVPAFITNFINQSRKLNCSISIASQRPVAVYPSYRALTDYMVHVENHKNKGIKYTSKKYYVDFNESALPDVGILEKEKKFFGLVEVSVGEDKGELYKDFKGKDVYYYFHTRQSFGLQELIKEHEQAKMT